MEFWHDLVTDKSWRLLQELRQKFEFVLIGGWAVYLYARTLKSKDIDLIADYKTLGRMQQAYSLVKNDRLKKYEIPSGEFDVDIYVPHYSNPGIPAEVVLKQAVVRENFKVPALEALLLMKENAHHERQGTPKGEKDGMDLLSLLSAEPLDWGAFHALAARYAPEAPQRLKQFLKNIHDAPYLNLNRHQLSRLKRSWLERLSLPA